MWNPIMKPTPLTIESLNTRRERRLERNRRGNTSPVNGMQEIVRLSHPDPCLKSGTNLPAYRKVLFTPELLNVPLEDLDPFYADAETFVVVTEKKLLHRFSAQNTLNLFSPFNPVRRTCICLLHHWIYRWLIIMAVFGDSCLLAWPNIDHQLIVFYFFGAIYTFDFVTNVIASGLIFDQFTFLRDGWGIVDLLLLVPYYIPFIGRHHFLCGLRSLKIAALIPSFGSMVKVVLKTVADLRDMFLWTLFATWIFTLVGYHFYKDISTQKCVLDFPEDGSVVENRDLNWHAWISNTSNWLGYYGFGYLKCGNHSMTEQCQKLGNFTCLQVRHPDDGLYSSMSVSLMSTVQIMLQDSWDDIYDEILKSGGPWHALYFVVTLFFGSFYTLNMILAVVSKSYDDFKKEKKLAETLDSCRCKRRTSNVSRSNDGEIDEDNFRDPNKNNQNGNITAEFHCKNPISTIGTRFTTLINVITFHPVTRLIMAIATVANLIFLSMDNYKVENNSQLRLILESGYQVFGFMFAVEGFMKFVACGPITFFKEKWNLFDTWQTVLFLVEYKFEFNSRWMKALLSLRSLRIFQLARIWPTLNAMLNGVFSVMGTVSEMTIVAIGVFYIFCVTGVHLFGGKIETKHRWSHWHFRDFWHSFIVIFRLLCGSWMDSMLECYDDYGWTCIPFFISAVIVLDMIILNLLLVMFLQRFAATNLSTNGRNMKADTNKVTVAINQFKRLLRSTKAKVGAHLRRKKTSKVVPFSEVEEEQITQVEASAPNKAFCGCPKLRVKLQTIMNSKCFKYFNIGITILATVCLSLRDVHLGSRPLLQDILNVAENIALFFMAVEAAVKLVAMKFSAYVKDRWNIFDFFIVLASIFNIIMAIFGYGTTALLRSMRVLRLFSIFKGMRILLNSLGGAMYKIIGILLVCLLIWLACAIVGVQLLSGRFQGCSYNGVIRVNRNKKECLQQDFVWINLHWGTDFDNIGAAYMRVLEIITFKGWGFIFNRATESGEIDEQPSFERSFWISGYFVAVILFGSFFAFNLFTGVFIDALNEEKSKTEADATNNRKVGYHDARNYMQDKLKRKFSNADIYSLKYQKVILGVVTSKHFGTVIFLNLVFNMVLLSMEQGIDNAPYMDILLILNGVCTAIFASESLLNMFALGCKFFRNPRNMFELFTELLSIFDILWTYVALRTSVVPFRPGLLRLVRFTWVSRYLRHVRAADGLRQLLTVLHISLPAFSNICVLLLLVVLIYGLLGMELFQHVPSNTILRHFQTLPAAFVYLFPKITSAGWNDLMAYLFNDYYCGYNDKNTPWLCGNDFVAGIYVISYLFITFVILVNLLSAVILESYSRAIKLADCELTDDHLEIFDEVWSKFDTENSQFVGCHNLADIFESFEPPLQVSKPNQCAISLMNIPIYQGNLVHCADVLDAAVTFLYFRKGVISAEEFTQTQDEMKNWKGSEKEITSSTFQIQRELQSAKVIQRAWRKTFLTSSLELWNILPF